MSATPIIVEVGGEPRGKARPRFSRKSRSVYTPPATATYEETIGWSARAAMRQRKPIEGPVLVEMFAVLRIPQGWTKAKQEAARNGKILPTKKPDADNILKMMDGLNGIVWKDDAQVVDAHVVKRYGFSPMLRIEVTELEPPREVPFDG